MRESNQPESRRDVDLAPIGGTRMPVTRTSDATHDAMEAVTAKIAGLAQKMDALIEAQEREQAEARHRELQRIVDEAGARVMRGEVRHTPSAAIRTHLFWRSE
jgi:predicted urease superfamily metal-dependent hydrolase